MRKVLCSLTTLLLFFTLLISCSKNDRQSEIENSNGINAHSENLKNALKAQKTGQKHPKEVPLNKDFAKQQNVASPSYQTANSNNFACGNYFFGESFGYGEVHYQDIPLDFSNNTESSIHVRAWLGAWGTPNRFAIYDPNGILVASTGWLGQTMTSGPWGSFLNGPGELELEFVVKNLSGYKLKVETFITENTDYWDVQINCISIKSRLNNLGQLHNDFQENVFTHLAGQNINITDTTLIGQIIQSKAQQFFSNNGINGPLLPTYFAHYGKNSTGLPTTGHSPAANQIMIRLNSLITNPNATYNSAFFDSLSILQQQALNLPNIEEVYLIGLPVTIASYSFTYWINNATRWANTFYQSSLATSKSGSLNNIQAAAACNINYWSLGVSDVTGGFRGAKLGFAYAGLHGAAAGGVLGAATGSATALVNEIISCYIPQWPF